jgi:hypothetical protein
VDVVAALSWGGTAAAISETIAQSRTDQSVDASAELSLLVHHQRIRRRIARVKLALCRQRVVQRGSCRFGQTFR